MPIVRIGAVCGTLNPGARAECRSCGVSLAAVEPVEADTLPPHVREAGRVVPVPPAGADDPPPPRAAHPATHPAGGSALRADGSRHPVLDLVRLLVKLALAAIPALLILMILGFLLGVGLGAVVG